MCPPDKRIAGRVEIAQVRGPFLRLTTLPNGQQGYVQDAVMAWKWLIDNAPAFQPPLLFPPSVAFEPVLEDPQYNPQLDSQPNLIGVHLTPVPTVQRAPIEAPTMQPTGNPGAPLVQGETWLPNERLPSGFAGGGFEVLTDKALPRTVDPMVGETDPEAGTFTDVEITGIETKRQMLKPYGPNPAQRGT
jgi:hypothetical protein